MSFDFRGLVPPSDDPMSQVVVFLQKQLAKFLTKDQIDQLDDSEDIFSDGQDFDVAIKWHTNLSGVHKFKFVRDFYVPIDPGTMVKVWLRGYNTGNTLRDFSHYRNTAQIYGDPNLVDGIINLGTQTDGVLSTALRLNHPGGEFENQEWLEVPQADNIRIAELTTGFSEFSRFKIYSLASQGGRSPTIYEKIDGSTPNNGRMLQVKDDGRLVYIVKYLGTEYKKETTTGVITANSLTGVPYDVFTTFNCSTHAIHIYLNGIDLSLSNFTGNTNWQTDTSLSKRNLFVFRRGAGTTEGFVYGDFYDYKLYSEKVVSQTEVTHHYTNKWSISDIAFGHVPLANHFACFVEPGGEEGLGSFSSASFSSSSFHIRT